MSTRVKVGGLSVAAELHRFVEQEALAGTGIDSNQFWSGVESLIQEFSPRNGELLRRREVLQAAINEYHRQRPGPVDPTHYQAFLRSIDYLVPEPADFEVATEGVDSEVSRQAGPQLVVPVLNARFAVNAANARWGSLYDALYGTDVIPDTEGRERGTAYNQVRGDEVVARGRAFLDAHFPLTDAKHAHATAYVVDDQGLAVVVAGEQRRLAVPEQLVGYRGDRDRPDAVVLTHHGLRVEIQVDPSHPVGSTDKAGVKDLLLEAALSTIMDLEDSVSAVDAADKVQAYRNWLRLMQGTLTEEVTKDGNTFTRTLHADRTCIALDGTAVTLPGRSLMLVRQVGHLMTTSAVFDAEGNEVPEGILDAVMTALGGLHDLAGTSALHNSRTGAIYAVKPKMHGPEEVAFTCELYDRTEQLLGLPATTLKVGIMDEERRTSANLKACIHAARDRVAFINTGFLDRTGDEIHTSMLAGPMVRKAEMKTQRWIAAYEDANVDIGLACGLRGRAQIGKGMWAAPDNMAEMVEQKGAHPRAGASCAWVPSPTAATLHALHYHEVDVQERQRILADRPRRALEDLLTIPLGDPQMWSPDDVQAELDNNLQGTLGYVVRWVDGGVGCSKVPDLSGVALMEDRATCRISSQHVANWLWHGVVTQAQVEESLRRMAAVVDEQNASDPTYAPMAPGFDGQAFRAARELVLEGTNQPSGYTEPVLHRRRTAVKTN